MNITDMELVNGIEYRPIREHEILALERAMSRGFGSHFNARSGVLEADKEVIDVERSLCAFDQGEIIGTIFSLEYQVSVPVGSGMPMGAVTGVTVSPTHRRRGILTEMMRRLLRNEHERGIPLAGLMASESIIYGRFGFGNAVQHQEASIATRHSAFKPMPEPPGKIRFTSYDDIKKVAPKVWDRAMNSHPGMVQRLPTEWNQYANHRDPKPFFIVYEEGERALGYSKYQVRFDEDADGDGILPVHKLQVNDLIAVVPRAETALWRFVLDVDLMSVVAHGKHPMPSRLFWMLADPRRLSLNPYDALWLRILDPAAALGSRGYSVAGSINIRVMDDFCPWVDGIYRLEADGDSYAACKRLGSNAAYDLIMPAASLATVYMGAHSLRTLHSAGRVAEQTSGTVELADNMFTTSEEPYLGHEF